MMFYKKSVCVCSMIVVGLIASCQSETKVSSQPDHHGFRHRLVELRNTIDAVAHALDDSKGFPKKAGDIDLQVARFFADYIAWELDHPQIMKDALLASNIFKPNVEVDPSEREKRYQRYIDYELSSSMKILDQALRRLNTAADWPMVPDIPWNRMVYQNGFFRVDGHPVFPEGFNLLPRSMIDRSRYPQWAEKDEKLTRSFLQKMHRLGVGLLGTGISVPSLVMPDGQVNTSAIDNLVHKIQQYGRMGFKVDILLNWRGNSETLESRWPGITDYYGNGIPLDIDHPGTRILIARVMAKLIPALRDLPTILSWDLANEPFFDLDQWSPFTLRKYHAWLAEHYPTIESLNAVWKTHYSSFRAIPLPKDKPRQQCSAGEWYDRITFHSDRVTSFFEFIQRRIRQYIPDAAIHLKGQDNSSLGPLPEAVTDGIDREMLTPLATMQGVDTRPLPVTEPRMAAKNRDNPTATILNYDGSWYGFHWLGQSFLYDYLTSLKPCRPIVDFEYHAFSINPIRIPNIPQSHARASLWMAHLHGLIGNMAWYWHRRYGPDPFPGKYFKAWLYGSLSTQPLIAAAYCQTMLKLNLFAEEVAALAGVPDRPVRIFVSKPSYIQNQAHINALHRVYEGLCFHGLRMGFVTEQMLAEAGPPKDCKIIVIPDAEYVSTPALQALERAKRQRIQLVRFGKRQITYDEHGIAHPPQSIAFLKDVPVFDYAPAPALSRQFDTLLRPLTDNLSVQVSIVGGHGAFGVMHRQTPVNGNLIVLLVNVSDRPVRVQLHSKEGLAIDGYDMLNHEAVKGEGLAMPFQGVRLIRMRVKPE